MDQLGITFVVLVPAIVAMMFVKRTEKIGWWLAGLGFVWLTFWSLGFTAEHYWRYKGQGCKSYRAFCESCDALVESTRQLEREGKFV